MANHSAIIKQAEATRMFKAAKNAGYDSTKLTFHPDGRVEVTASVSDVTVEAKGTSWDVLLK